MLLQEYPHGSKLEGRIKKYPEERKLLLELKEVYYNMRDKCLQIEVINSLDDLKLLVDYINTYLMFFSQNRFKKIKKNSQSKIYPSIAEEYMVYLFRGLIKEPFICGSATIPIMSSFKKYNDVVSCDSFEKSIYFETTDADFVIGIPKLSNTNRKQIIYPIVVIENKRYADKTMRRVIENTAEKVKLFSQDCIYLVVLDLLSGFFAKNYSPNTSSIDQIYGMKQGNKDGDDRLRIDVVEKLFERVYNHISDIQNPISLEERYERGYMMYK